jgi:hypothetical protein
MAVRTAHDTRLEFRDEHRPAAGSADEVLDGRKLSPANVIALEHDRIGFTTVNARMPA